MTKATSFQFILTETPLLPQKLLTLTSGGVRGKQSAQEGHLKRLAIFESEGQNFGCV